jgi:hypothetical protein
MMKYLMITEEKMQLEELRTCAWDMRSQELAPTPSRDVAG